MIEIFLFDVFYENPIHLEHPEPFAALPPILEGVVLSEFALHLGHAQKLSTSEDARSY